MAAQNQHYVPQLLLRGFHSHDPRRSKKEQVHVIDLCTGETFTPSISGIMSERRHNDFSIDRDILATIEPFACTIEDRCAPLINRVRAEKRLELSSENISYLALFMAFQFMRTKKMRLLPERMSRQLRSHIVRMGYNPDKVEGAASPDEVDLKIMHIRNQISGLGDYAEIISEKAFFLMTAPKGYNFYIGDHPVVLHCDEERSGVFRGLGLAVPYVQIYLPLSSDVTLCAFDKAIIGKIIGSQKESLFEIKKNLLTRLLRGEINSDQMRRIIVSIQDSDPVERLLRSIDAGDAVEASPDQVYLCNYLQGYQAQRFLIDPSGEFSIRQELIDDRKAASRDL